MDIIGFVTKIATIPKALDKVVIQSKHTYSEAHPKKVMILFFIVTYVNTQ